MIDKIIINIGIDHTFKSDSDIIGRSGEGYTSQLEIAIPESLRNWDVYLDFEKPNGVKFRTPKLRVEKGVTIYDIVPYLLTHSGEIKAQVVLKNANGSVWKSFVKEFYNQYSIIIE